MAETQRGETVTEGVFLKRLNCPQILPLNLSASQPSKRLPVQLFHIPLPLPDHSPGQTELRLHAPPKLCAKTNPAFLQLFFLGFYLVTVAKK